MPSTGDPINYDLPHLRDVIKVGDSASARLRDVKAYPFAKPEEDPVFAVVEQKQILVFRLKGASIEELRAFTDEDNAEICCVTWARSEDGLPLLCIAGESATIKVLDALAGEVVQDMAEYVDTTVATLLTSQPINDLAFLPGATHILVSCSSDHTVRLWSLRKAHRKSPTVALLAGEGHINSVLSISLHSSGLYLLSGGSDQRVNLWTIPDLSNEHVKRRQAQVVHYPHFSTSEVHSRPVDCVQFHNDLILSLGQGEGSIVLWQITKFSSSATPPTAHAAPTTYDEAARTRSAFFKVPDGDKAGPRPFQRLLQFEMPGSQNWHTRFSLFQPPSPQHAVLASSYASKAYFWDFARLAEYQESMAFGKEPHWLAAERKELSNTNTPEDKYAIGDPWKRMQAHKVVDLPMGGDVGHQTVAWSADGKFCIVLARQNVVAVLGR